MEQSNSEPINGNTAHDEPGKPNPESPAAKPDENSGETPAFKAMPNELFEKAVNDAQVLLDYVVRRNKTQIDEETLTTLIGAKQRIGTNQTVDAKTEAKFWLSYRKLLQLAGNVTAQSIRAAEAREALSAKARSAEVLEKAVRDSQLLLDYAVSQGKEEIDKESLKALIEAKQRIYADQDVKPEVEANFWVAYQKLQNQLSPVTAELIRAAKDKEKSIAKALTADPFEKAVDDAQLLLIYAVSKREGEIDKQMLETLIGVKQILESKQKVDSKSEADFWVAFRKLQQQVSPVTAESIRSARENEISIAKAMSTDSFEKAVEDAQLLLMYALGETKNAIDAKTLSTLIEAKWRLEADQEIKSDFEEQFWLAYHNLQQQVKPVTVQSIRATNRDASITRALTRQLFEEAVGEAQILMEYASSRCQKNITGEMIEKLAEVRERVNKKQKVSIREEVDFWLNYQALLELVKPVTVESIRATASKAARRSMNLHIVFTVSVLVVLLIFQVYWVVGNKLISDINAYENSDVQARATSTPSSENSVPGNEQTSTPPSSGSGSLDSTADQNMAILLVWSNPWDWVVIKRSDSNESETKKIEAQIQSIKEQRDADPTGATAAENQKSTLDRQLALIEEKIINKNLNCPEAKQPEDLPDGPCKDKRYIEQKTKWVNEKNLLEKKLENIVAVKELIQKKRSLLNSSAELEEQLQRKNDELNVLRQDSDNLNKEKEEIQTKIADQSRTPQASPTATLTATPEITPSPIPAEPQAALTGNNGTATQAASSTESNQQSGSLSAVEPVATVENSLGSATVTPTMIPLDTLKVRLEFLDGKLNESSSNLSTLYAEIEKITGQKGDIQKQVNEIDQKIREMELQLGSEQVGLKLEENPEIILEWLQGQEQTIREDMINTQAEIDRLPNLVDQVLAKEIVEKWDEEIERLTEERENLRSEELKDAIREDARPVLLAGQFVLQILQSYILPLLYGILGAGTYALRTLSKEIDQEIYSRRKAVQHVFRIALGALAGIMVGWFAPKDQLGSISPLAIAFLVGYNIEIFFRLMDRLIDPIINKAPQKEEN